MNSPKEAVAGQSILNSYLQSVKGEIDMHKSVMLVQERMALYAIMAQADRLYQIYSPEWKDHIIQEVFKTNLMYKDLLSKKEGLSLKEMDSVAHQLCLIVYCERNEHTMFLRTEHKFFNLRYLLASESEVDAFLEENNNFGVNLRELDSLEKISLNRDKNYICNSLQINTDDFGSARIMKTPFEQASLVLRRERCFLNEGSLFFLHASLGWFMMDKLKFSRKTVMMRDMLKSDLDETAERFLFEFDRMNRRIVTNTPKVYTSVLQCFHLYDVDQISRNFPPCMKLIHQHFKDKHHMKYPQRMQYGLFLKFIGVEYEDAMEFYQTEFTKEFTLTEYKKRYEYLFKHFYGKVGFTHGYKPASCEKIITSPTTHGVISGCPFQRFDDDQLKKYLKTEGIPYEGQTKILDLKRQNKFQSGCAVFLGERNSSPNYSTDDIVSPQEYFTRCQTCTCPSSDIEDLFN